MAEQRGGYRRPAKPAPVSGPGALSKRTDGGPSQGARYMRGGSYGEGQEMMGLQQAAPMAAGPSAPSAPVAFPDGRTPKITPLFADTEFPDEPLTTGNPLGPGGGPELMNIPAKPTLIDSLRKLANADSTGEVNLLLNWLDRRGF
jgi:hypothetical protein